MGVRTTFNEKPWVAYLVAAVLVAIAGLVIFQTRPEPTPVGPPQLEYYSSDDGQTYFTDDRGKPLPYEHETGQAYHATVFECDGDPFVGYLTRYTPDINERVEAHDGTTFPVGLQMAINQRGHEVRKPGDDAWVPVTDQEAYARVTTVRCDDGSLARPLFPD